MDFTPIYKLFALKGELLEPPRSSHPILTDGYDLFPNLIAMILEQPFYGQVDEDPYTHLREFEQLCSCRSISGMTRETLKCKLFPFSLLGRAKKWNAHSVGGGNGNWDELCLTFFPLFESLFEKMKCIFSIPPVGNLEKSRETLTGRWLLEHRTLSLSVRCRQCLAQLG